MIWQLPADLRLYFYYEICFFFSKFYIHFKSTYLCYLKLIPNNTNSLRFKPDEFCSGDYCYKQHVFFSFSKLFNVYKLIKVLHSNASISYTYIHITPYLNPFYMWSFLSSSFAMKYVSNRVFSKTVIPL